MIVPRGDEQVIRTALLAAERGEYQAIADYIEIVKAREATTPYRRQPALQPFTWTDEVLEEAIAGRIMVYRQLTSRERLRFEEAKRLGYLVRRESKRALINVWWAWCELRRRPVIEVRPRRRYASVKMDAVTVPTIDGPKLPEAIASAIWAVLDRHAVRGIWRGAGTWSEAEAVPIEVAPAVAAQLVPLANLMAADGAEAESLRQYREHHGRTS